MRSFITRLSACIILLAIITSCSVQKRRYTKGWHVSWASSHSKSKEADKSTVKTYQAKPVENKNTEMITAYADKKVASTSSATKPAVESKTEVNSIKKDEISHKSSPYSIKSSVLTAKKKIKAVDTKVKAAADNDNTDTLAILSFIFGILGFLLIPAIVAVVLGNMAIKQYKAGSGDSNKRIFAVLGLVFGWIFIGLFLLYILIVFLLISVLLGL